MYDKSSPFYNNKDLEVKVALGCTHIVVKPHFIIALMIFFFGKDYNKPKP